MQNTETKAKLMELRLNFTRLKQQCTGFVRICPETLERYQKEIAQLEARLN